MHAHPILPATCASLGLLISTCLCSHPQVSTEAQLVAALDHTQTDAADKLCFIECIIHTDDCSRELLEWGGEFRVGFSCLSGAVSAYREDEKREGRRGLGGACRPPGEVGNMEAASYSWHAASLLERRARLCWQACCAC